MPKLTTRAVLRKAKSLADNPKTIVLRERPDALSPRQREEADHELNSLNGELADLRERRKEHAKDLAKACKKAEHKNLLNWVHDAARWVLTTDGTNDDAMEYLSEAMEWVDKSQRIAEDVDKVRTDIGNLKVKFGYKRYELTSNGSICSFQEFTADTLREVDEYLNDLQTKGKKITSASF